MLVRTAKQASVSLVFVVAAAMFAITSAIVTHILLRHGAEARLETAFVATGHPRVGYGTVDGHWYGLCSIADTIAP